MSQNLKKKRRSLSKRVFRIENGRAQAEVDRANHFAGKILQTIKGMYARGYGKSKHSYKKTHHGKPDVTICYAEQTAITCYERAMVFLTWALDSGLVRRVSRWQELLDFLPDYLRLRSELWSADTVHTDASYLCKLFGVLMSDYPHPRRSRAQVTKCRDTLERFAEFATRYPELVSFCLCTGLRKGKELAVAQGDHLRFRRGEALLHVIGKGGLERDVPFIGSPEDCALAIGLCRAAGSELVFPTLPRGVPVHGLRAMYVSAQYLMLARPVAELPKEERYVCRGDYKGIVLDRAALMAISPTIGHKRISVLVQSYIWPLLPWLRGEVLASPLPGV